MQKVPGHMLRVAMAVILCLVALLQQAGVAVGQISLLVQVAVAAAVAAVTTGRVVLVQQIRATTAGRVLGQTGSLLAAVVVLVAWGSHQPPIRPTAVTAVQEFRRQLLVQQ